MSAIERIKLLLLNTNNLINNCNLNLNIDNSDILPIELKSENSNNNINNEIDNLNNEINENLNKNDEFNNSFNLLKFPEIVYYFLLRILKIIHKKMIHQFHHHLNHLKLMKIYHLIILQIMIIQK